MPDQPEPGEDSAGQDSVPVEDTTQGVHGLEHGEERQHYARRAKILLQTLGLELDR